MAVVVNGSSLDCNNLHPTVICVFAGLEKMTEQAAPDEVHKETLQELATSAGTMSIQPRNEIEDPMASHIGDGDHAKVTKSISTVSQNKIFVS